MGRLGMGVGRLAQGQGQGLEIGVRRGGRVRGRHRPAAAGGESGLPSTPRPSRNGRNG